MYIVGRRPIVTIGPGAIVCEEAILKGDVTIGPRTVVHPRASIIAEAGPISIGEGNIIEEMATIINKTTLDDRTHVQIIGNYNVFEVDSTCEAFSVGDNNILECKAFVPKEIQLTNGCIIGSGCSLVENSAECIPENTIIYGSECQRREMNDKPYPQIGQLDYLTKILPNYHHIIKPKLAKKKSTN